MDKDIVAQWLKEYVGDNYCDSFWGHYDFKTVKMMQNVGAVYGIWMKGTSEEIETFAITCKKDVEDIKKEFKGYVPIYWGKDISPCHRLSAHLKTSPKTGGLNLIQSTYRDKEIIFGCVLTKKYFEIEKSLHKKYPVGHRDSAGRKSTRRIIMK